ncbi:unnamed protein product [Prorocentrum cordatum]|uniref:Skin secretory protein xP2-like n=1 Tax=Prorocentrum cordatum TaxID=2364126 RepID=A0ABN9RKN9_9DINO|nr:unnamed protein product [Polarella glacialis]
MPSQASAGVAEAAQAAPPSASPARQGAAEGAAEAVPAAPGGDGSLGPCAGGTALARVPSEAPPPAVASAEPGAALPASPRRASPRAPAGPGARSCPPPALRGRPRPGHQVARDTVDGHKLFHISSVAALIDPEESPPACRQRRPASPEAPPWRSPPAGPCQ